MLLEEFLQKEKELYELDNITIHRDIPLYRVVRTEFRARYLRYSAKTVNSQIEIFQQCCNYLKSLISYIKIITTKKHYENLIFPHPRLYMVDGIYMERLTDPLIDYTKIGKSYLILERHQNGIHKRPRCHSENLIYLDFIDFTATLLNFFFKYAIRIKYKNEVNRIYDLLDVAFKIAPAYKNLFYNVISKFVISKFLITHILAATTPKRIFVAPRSTYMYAIAAAKKLSIQSYELQHGITFGETVLYSGVYNQNVDPDYFLGFGKISVNECFAMPLNRIVNIGFAYKKFIQERIKSNYIKIPENIVLFISEPQISQLAIKTLLLLSEKYPDIYFHIRCHPQEKISDADIQKISDTKIDVVDNTLESFLAISRYKYVIGENSSSIFEAFSLGKLVGRLNFNGFKSIVDGDFNIGYMINTVEDFGDFLHLSNNATEYNGNDSMKNIDNIYSDFDCEVVNNLI